MKNTVRKITTVLLVLMLAAGLIASAMAETVFMTQRFVIPAERVGGVRIDVQEPDDPAETLPDATTDVGTEETVEIQVNPEALDENVEGLVVVDGDEKTEDTNDTKQTEVRTNNADNNSNTDNAEIQDEISEPAVIDEEIEITVTQDNESEQYESSVENEVIYLENDEGNVILDDNGNPISYIAAETDDTEEELKITYQKDENGNLILDDAREPIPIVPEGMEIPVRFERDASGQLILDENGDPICLEAIAAGSQKIMDIYDMLDPNRSISMYFNYYGKEGVWFGDPVEMIAVAKGYDNVDYTYQWQYSIDNENWIDIPEETAKAMVVVIDEENCMNWWRVQVVIEMPDEVI